MDEGDFDSLRRSLEGLHLIFEVFCTRHGWALVNPGSLGRYPRIRVERVGTPTIWFDLWMELDSEGRRFEQFSERLPFELSIGAYFDVDERTRFSTTCRCFTGRTAAEVRMTLAEELERWLPLLESWTVEYVAANGRRVELHAS